MAARVASFRSALKTDGVAKEADLSLKKLVDDCLSASRQRSTSPSRLHDLAVEFSQSCGKLSPKQITLCLNAFVKSPYRNAELFERSLLSCIPRLSSFGAQDLANAFNSIARLPLRSDALMAAFTEQVTRRTHEFSGRDAALFVNGFAKLSVYEASVFESLGQSLVSRRRELNGQEIALSANAWAKFDLRSEEASEVLEALVEETASRMSEMNGQNLALTANAFVKLSVGLNDALVEAFAHQAVLRAPEMEPHHLSVLAHALTKARDPPSDSVVRALVDVAPSVLRGVPSLDPHNLVQVAYAYGKALSSRCGSAFEQRTPRPSQTVPVLPHLWTSRQQQNGGLVEGDLKKRQKQNGGMVGGDLEKFTLTEEQKAMCLKVFEAVGERARESCKSLTGAEVGSLASSFASVGLVDFHLFKALEARALQVLPFLNSWSMGVLLNAFAKSGMGSSKLFLESARVVSTQCESEVRGRGEPGQRLKFVADGEGGLLSVVLISSALTRVDRLGRLRVSQTEKLQSELGGGVPAVGEQEVVAGGERERETHPEVELALDGLSQSVEVQFKRGGRSKHHSCSSVIRQTERGRVRDETAATMSLPPLSPGHVAELSNAFTKGKGRGAFWRAVRISPLVRKTVPLMSPESLALSVLSLGRAADALEGVASLSRGSAAQRNASGSPSLSFDPIEEGRRMKDGGIGMADADVHHVGSAEMFSTLEALALEFLGRGGIRDESREHGDLPFLFAAGFGKALGSCAYQGGGGGSESVTGRDSTGLRRAFDLCLEDCFFTLDAAENERGMGQGVRIRGDQCVSLWESLLNARYGRMEVTRVTGRERSLETLTDLTARLIVGGFPQKLEIQSRRDQGIREKAEMRDCKQERETEPPMMEALPLLSLSQAAGICTSSVRMGILSMSMVDAITKRTSALRLCLSSPASSGVSLEPLSSFISLLAASLVYPSPNRALPDCLGEERIVRALREVCSVGASLVRNVLQSPPPQSAHSSSEPFVGRVASLLWLESFGLSTALQVVRRAVTVTAEGQRFFSLNTTAGVPAVSGPVFCAPEEMDHSCFFPASSHSSTETDTGGGHAGPVVGPSGAAVSTGMRAAVGRLRIAFRALTIVSPLPLRPLRHSRLQQTNLAATGGLQTIRAEGAQRAYSCATYSTQSVPVPQRPRGRSEGAQASGSPSRKGARGEEREVPPVYGVEGEAASESCDFFSNSKEASNHDLEGGDSKGGQEEEGRTRGPKASLFHDSSRSLHPPRSVGGPVVELASFVEGAGEVLQRLDGSEGGRPTSRVSSHGSASPLPPQDAHAREESGDAAGGRSKLPMTGSRLGPAITGHSSQAHQGVLDALAGLGVSPRNEVPAGPYCIDILLPPDSD